MKTLVVTLLLLVFSPMSSALSSDIDLHEYWDQRCKDCHGHSSEFARRSLRVDDGRLVGAHHREDLDVFLRNHYLADGLEGPVVAMLTAQLSTPPLFGEKCARCHGTAAEFARKSLVIRNDVLLGLSSGRAVADFLSSHGGLKRDEVPLVVDSLTRVRNEVSRPGKD